jgi:hypothetical protein
MDYFSRRSRLKKNRETKSVEGWHLNPDVESKYFHEKDLNNSYFVLFLWNKILYFHSHVKKNQILIWRAVLAL